MLLDIGIQTGKCIYKFWWKKIIKYYKTIIQSVLLLYNKTLSIKLFVLTCQVFIKFLNLCFFFSYFLHLCNVLYPLYVHKFLLNVLHIIHRLLVENNIVLIFQHICNHEHFFFSSGSSSKFIPMIFIGMLNLF